MLLLHKIPRSQYNPTNQTCKLL